MENSAPPINESVALLAKYAPKRLERLRQELPPEIAPLLEPGGLLGPSDPLLLARAQVCLASLKQTVVVCTNGIKAAERRLKLSRRAHLVAEIAASITSLGVLASLLNPDLTVKIVTFIGSLATIVSSYAGRIPEDGKTSLFETYSQLVEGRFEASQLSQEIEIYLKKDITDQQGVELGKLIGEGNALCQKLNLLQTTLLNSASVEVIKNSSN
jgi:hypothetical protein